MKPKRLYHAVAQSILDMINSGDYPPGTRLPGERELATRFGVSRVVVREAEISLETLGKVEIRVGSGVYVSDPNTVGSLPLPSVTAFGLTQTRLLFESECAALAARLITDEQVARLEDTIETMANVPSDSPEGHKADHTFHLLIAEATGNEANVAVLQNIWLMRNEIDAVQRVYAAVGEKDSTDRVKEHLDILSAIRDRDPNATRQAMRRHFLRLLNALLDHSEDVAIEEARRASRSNRALYLHPGVDD